MLTFTIEAACALLPANSSHALFSQDNHTYRVLNFEPLYRQLATPTRRTKEEDDQLCGEWKERVVRELDDLKRHAPEVYDCIPRFLASECGEINGALYGKCFYGIATGNSLKAAQLAAEMQYQGHWNERHTTTGTNIETLVLALFNCHISVVSFEGVTRGLFRSWLQEHCRQGQEALASV